MKQQPSNIFSPRLIIIAGAILVGALYVLLHQQEITSWVDQVEQEQGIERPSTEDFTKVLSEAEELKEQAFGEQGVNQQIHLALAYYQQGKTLADAGEHEASLAWYQKALELFPSEAQFHQAIAISYRALGETEKAKIHEELALNLEG